MSASLRSYDEQYVQKMADLIALFARQELDDEGEKGWRERDSTYGIGTG
jgi:hypothetical protein